MSLFASLGQGDIWSISGITFGSPINDILDKGPEFFNLEELLEEDELLQEVKSRNGRLIDFLCNDESITKLVEYVTTPAGPEDSELRHFKYPYMSCELICLEVNELLHVLVHANDSKHLVHFMTFLDSTTALDHHLAGYFEKILEMLFRRETERIIAYINDGGSELFLRFLSHIGNYSIMQIVQRLMLPHIPFSVLAEADSLTAEERSSLQCKWSFSSEYCNMLCAKMMQEGQSDVPSHISDLFITVIQLSPPDALVISNMCEEECLDRLIVAIFSGIGNSSVPSMESCSSAPSISLAAISVLESLISRLSESLGPSDESQNATQEEDYYRVVSITKRCIEKSCSCFKRHCSDLCEHLKFYLDPSSCDSHLSQSKVDFPRLGHRGLQLIKLIESIVRLGESEMENELCAAGIIAVTLDLMFHFRLNSLLHLSVQRIVLMIVERADLRRPVVRHILFECKLLQRLMDFLCAARELDSHIDEGLNSADARPVGLIAGSRSPLIGHIVLISQTILNASHPEASISEADVSMSSNLPEENSVEIDGELGFPLTKASSGESVRALIAEAGLLEAWDHFVENTLSYYLDKQTATQLGGDLQGSPLSDLDCRLGESSDKLLQLNYPWGMQGSEREDDDDDDDDENVEVPDYRSRDDDNSFQPSPSIDLADFADFGSSSAFDTPDDPPYDENFADFADFSSAPVASTTSSHEAFSDPFESNSFANFADFADFEQNSGRSAFPDEPSEEHEVQESDVDS